MRRHYSMPSAKSSGNLEGATNGYSARLVYLISSRFYFVMSIDCPIRIHLPCSTPVHARSITSDWSPPKSLAIVLLVTFVEGLLRTRSGT